MKRPLLFEVIVSVLTGSLAGLLLSLPAEAQDIEERLQLCQSCHLEGRVPEDPAVPIIAGQEFYYLYVQLRDYQAGRREHEVMSGIAADLTKEEMQALAQHFSEQPWPATGYQAPEGAIAKGERAASAGVCVQCHLGGYEGNSRIPRLAGQTEDYLERTMLDFKANRRKNSPAKASLLESFNEDDIKAMAQFLADL
jgi:cytochrome c553